MDTQPPDAPNLGDELAPGTRVGACVIERRLGRGGCATVYAAVDGEGHRLAVKVMHAELVQAPSMKARFAREVGAAARLRHPAVVSVYELGELPDGRPWFTMELVEGEDVEAHVARRGRLPAREALAVLEPLGGALAAAHEAGLIHRDVKPANVLVGPGGVRLVDFGVAKIVEPEEGAGGLTLGRRVGSPIAMAPEQLRAAAVDARSDVYGLGILAFFLLAGRYPFESADVIELELMHLQAPPPPPSRFAAVSPAVDAVILRCLEKRPEARFPSVGAFLAALRQAVGEGGERPAQRTRALAVYVGARLPEDRELDDDSAEGLADLLDLARRRLAAAGLAPVLQASNALLAVSPLAGQDPDLRVRAEAAAGEILVAVNAAAWPALEWSIRVHDDEAELSGDGRVVGGPVLRLAWVCTD